MRDLGSIPGLGRFPGEGNGNPLQYLALKFPWTEELGAGYYPWGRKQLGTTEQLHFLSFTYITMRGFPDSSVGKQSACNAGDLDLISGSGRFPEEGIG